MLRGLLLFFTVAAMAQQSPKEIALLPVVPIENIQYSCATLPDQLLKLQNQILKMDSVFVDFVGHLAGEYTNWYDELLQKNSSAEAWPEGYFVFLETSIENFNTSAEQVYEINEQFDKLNEDLSSAIANCNFNSPNLNNRLQKLKQAREMLAEHVLSVADFFNSMQARLNKHWQLFKKLEGQSAEAEPDIFLVLKRDVEVYHEAQKLLRANSDWVELRYQELQEMTRR
jgi:hypothetical protein